MPRLHGWHSPHSYVELYGGYSLNRIQNMDDRPVDGIKRLDSQMGEANMMDKAWL